MKERVNKSMTIDDLAIMVKHGFDDMGKRIDETASKEDLARVARSLTQLTEKVDNLEGKIVGNHDRRLDKLEDNMIQMKTLLKVR